MIGAEGATAIAEALASNSKLADLNVQHGNIQDDGAIAFARMLGRNTALKRLDLKVR